MLAIDKAIERVEQNNYGNIPSYLKDNHYYDAKKRWVLEKITNIHTTTQTTG